MRGRRVCVCVFGGGRNVCKGWRNEGFMKSFCPHHHEGEKATEKNCTECSLLPRAGTQRTWTTHLAVVRERMGGGKAGSASRMCLELSCGTSSLDGTGVENALAGRAGRTQTERIEAVRFSVVAVSRTQRVHAVIMTMSNAVRIASFAVHTERTPLQRGWPVRVQSFRAIVLIRIYRRQSKSGWLLLLLRKRQEKENTSLGGLLKKTTHFLWFPVGYKRILLQEAPSSHFFGVGGPRADTGLDGVADDWPPVRADDAMRSAAAADPSRSFKSRSASAGLG